jgi:transcription elongation factor Elf1
MQSLLWRGAIPIHHLWQRLQARKFANRCIACEARNPSANRVISKMVRVRLVITCGGCGCYAYCWAPTTCNATNMYPRMIPAVNYSQFSLL